MRFIQLYRAMLAAIALAFFATNASSEELAFADITFGVAAYTPSIFPKTMLGI